MRAKSSVLLVIAMGCGIIAAVAVSKTVMEKGPAAPAEATVEIFVAVKDLPHAQKITADVVKLEKWPKSRIPEGSLTHLEQLEDKFTNQMLFAGEPILDRKLADSRESFSTAIPPGYRVFDIPGSAGYIKPGDHVDILGTFRIGGRNAAPESRTVMRNVQVFGINGVTTRDSDANANAGKGSVFQLLVKESQLEALTLANSLGELRLNLRPFGEDTQESLSDNGESFISWINATEAENNDKTETFTSLPLSNKRPSSDAIRPTEAPQEMVIITPNGMKRYQWKDNEIPQEVSDTHAQPAASPAAAAPPWAPANGNVYSGYGGYTPTYPTSVAPQETDQVPVEASNGETPQAID